jgi:hypothetical protein
MRMVDELQNRSFNAIKECHDLQLGREPPKIAPRSVVSVTLETRLSKTRSDQETCFFYGRLSRNLRVLFLESP